MEKFERSDIGSTLSFESLAPCRKLVFEELLGKAKERVAKEEKRRKRAREDFSTLLRNSRHIRSSTTWEEGQTMLEKEPEFKAVSV